MVILISCFFFNQASLLALAGKFDSVILAGTPSSDSYLVMSEQDTDYDINNTSQPNNESIFQEEYDQEDDNAIEYSNKSIKLTKEGSPAQKRRCITAFSSGTGLAGIVGYGYKAFFADVFGWSLSYIVWSAVLFSFAYWRIFNKGLCELERNHSNNDTMHSEHSNNEHMQQNRPISRETSESPLLMTKLKCNNIESIEIADSTIAKSNSFVEEYGQIESNKGSTEVEESGSSLEMVGHHEANNPQEKHDEDLCPRRQSYMSTQQSASAVPSTDLTAFRRFTMVLSLWPYTIPLFTVYLAEYMLQAGVWSTIGFPVTSASARAQFYQYR